MLGLIDQATDLFVDQVGRLWIRDYWRTATGRTAIPGYVIFASDGTLIGRYEPPRAVGIGRATVTDAGTDYIVIRVSAPDEGIRVIVQAIAPAR